MGKVQGRDSSDVCIHLLCRWTTDRYSELRHFLGHFEGRRRQIVTKRAAARGEARIQGMDGIEGYVMVGSGRGDELPARQARKPGRVTVIASANTGEGRAGSLEQGERRLTDSDDNNPVTQD